MYKILLFLFVFGSGVVLGGGVRYGQVKAQLATAEITKTVAPASSAPLGGNGGSCG